MEGRELETTVRSIQSEDIIADDQPHIVMFADFVENLLNENYSSEEKEQLNKIFLTRDKTLKPRRKDEVPSRTILSILAAEYEKFIFDTLKRRMEEQVACRNTKSSEPCATKCD